MYFCGFPVRIIVASLKEFKKMLPQLLYCWINLGPHEAEKYFYGKHHLGNVSSSKIGKYIYLHLMDAYYQKYINNSKKGY